MKCPKGEKPMEPRAASGGYAPPGFTAENDHWWCSDCAEVVLFDEEAPDNDEVRRQLGPTGKEKTR